MGEGGLLSQAEIDALTASLGSKDASGFNPEALRASFETFADQANHVLGALLGKSVEIETGAPQPGDAAAAMEGFESESLAILSGFEHGFQGELAVLLRKEFAAKLAQGMTGATGPATFQPDHLDAMNELGNQIMGAFATALGTRFEITLSSAPAKAENFNPSAPPFDLSGGAMADFEIRVEGTALGKLRLLFSQPLVMAFTDPTETEGDMPAAPHFGAAMLPAASVDTSLTMPEGATPNVELLLDVPLNITIELGRTRLSIRRILELGPGSIIELDRLAGEPVDLLVNDKVVARGEVVVVDEYFGIRILSLISPAERIQQLR